jgi:hypothetical protein
MHETADLFLKQYGVATFPNSSELLGRLLRERHRLRRADLASGRARCSELAKDYEERCWTVGEYHGKRDSELYQEFRDMVEVFRAPPDEPCSLWHFVFDDEAGFAVFERVESRTIAWCMKRYPFPATKEDYKQA